MADNIYSIAGQPIGSIEVDPSHRDRLIRGGAATIHFHTPRLLSAVMERHDFSFSLSMQNGRIVVNDVDAASKYVRLNDVIATAVAQPPKEEDL